MTVPRHPAARGGFTLIELLVVMVIIASLAGMTLWLVNSMLSQRRAVSTADTMTAIIKGVEMYIADAGRPTVPMTTGAELYTYLVELPPQWQQLSMGRGVGGFPNHNSDAYLTLNRRNLRVVAGKTEILDGWEQPLAIDITPTANGAVVTLTSAGPDKKMATTEDNIKRTETLK